MWNHVFSPEQEKGLKKKAKLFVQVSEHRENGAGDSDNEADEVRILFFRIHSQYIIYC